jgi:hypothetical protein
VLEELEHERRIELLELEIGGRHAELLAHEPKEELEGIRVGVAGVRAGAVIDGRM